MPKRTFKNQTKTQQKTMNWQNRYFLKKRTIRPYKTFEKMSFVLKQIFFVIFLKCFSTLNAACHFLKRKFELSDRRKTLQKMTKNICFKTNHIFSTDKSHIAQNLFKFCDQIVGKSFHFLMHFWWNAKTHFFLKFYVVVAVILDKSFDFVVDFL
jgi:hypothetical protein